MPVDETPMQRRRPGDDPGAEAYLSNRHIGRTFPEGAQGRTFDMRLDGTVVEVEPGEDVLAFPRRSTPPRMTLERLAHEGMSHEDGADDPSSGDDDDVSEVPVVDVPAAAVVDEAQLVREQMSDIFVRYVRAQPNNAARVCKIAEFMQNVFTSAHPTEAIDAMFALFAKRHPEMNDLMGEVLGNAFGI